MFIENYNKWLLWAGTFAPASCRRSPVKTSLHSSVFSSSFQGASKMCYYNGSVILRLLDAFLTSVSICAIKMSATLSSAARGSSICLPPTRHYRCVRLLWNSNIPSISKLTWLNSYYKYIELIFISIIKQSLKEIISSYKYTKKHQSERSQKNWTEHGL